MIKKTLNLEVKFFSEYLFFPKLLIHKLLYEIYLLLVLAVLNNHPDHIPNQHLV